MATTPPAPAPKSKPDEKPPRKKRKLWRTLSLISASFSILLLAYVFFSVRSVPGWYVPPTLDHAKLNDDKRDLTNMLDAIGGALNRGKTADLELNEGQLNRWLAARDEMPLPAEWSYEFPDIHGPQINLLDGDRIRLSGAVERGGRSYVFSFVVHLAVDGERLRITPVDVRIGSLGIPRFLLSWVSQRARAGGAGRDAIDLSQAVDTSAAGVWPNGRRPFQMEHLEVSVGRIKLQLRPR